MMKSIEVNNITKSYDLGKLGSGSLRESLQNLFVSRPSKEQFLALDDISFDVKPGETVGIIGKNGAGKSTLLKVLSQITKPTSGSAILRGRVASLLEVGTGFHPELTGRENVYLNGSILGMNRLEIKQKFDEIVDFSGVEKFLDTPVKRYSSGMYVRLAFAIAAHLDPEILIIDEVLAVGDADFQNKCLQKMDSVSSQGKSILFVSHNMASVQKICNRGLVLKSGQMHFNGTADEAVDFYLDNQASLAESLPLSERTDREGSGRLKFTDIKIKSSNGSSIALSGEDLTIELQLEALEQNVKDVSISIAISTEKGYQLCDLTSKSDDLAIKFVEGKTQVSCTMKHLPLNAGMYFFNLCLKSGSIVEDWIIHAGTFSIETGNFLAGQMPDEKQGALLIKQNWR